MQISTPFQAAASLLSSAQCLISHHALANWIGEAIALHFGRVQCDVTARRVVE